MPSDLAGQLLTCSVHKFMWIHIHINKTQTFLNTTNITKNLISLLTFVIVFNMATRSAGGGKPTKSVLSSRPGLRMAGSMISREERKTETPDSCCCCFLM